MYRGLRFCTLKSRRFGIAYKLAISDDPTSYERALAASRGPDKNTQLLILLLSGRGLLLDIGAHIGTVAVPVAMTGSRVVAIEMNSGNWPRLRASAIVNDLHRMQIVEAAASAQCGELRFAGTEAWGQVTGDATGTAVAAVTVDSILGNLKIDEHEPLLFKVDVEGHELEVFRGAERSLDVLRPTILFESIDCEGEVPGSALGCREFLSSLNYDLFLMRGTVLVPKLPTDIHEGLVGDYLAVPKEQRSALSPEGFEIRPLRDSERLIWIGEMVGAEPPHQRHAAGVILRWQREEPSMANKSSHMLAALLDMAHLSDLHESLAAVYAIQAQAV